jgi:tol-pal system protein YbgF
LKNSLLFFLAITFACAGCALQEDLYRSEARLAAKITALEKLVEENAESIKSGRTAQADVGADLIDVRDSLQKLRGATERLDVKVSALESKVAEPSPGLDDISKRLAYLETYLGPGKAEAPESEEETAVGSTEKGESAAKEEAYAKAYGMFKGGQYDAARDEFRTFLKAFPDTEYSDNAQFWIGECYYFQGKYEEAIIEYEAVVQNYPKGNKVPNALLKQGLSFLKLGDTSSARLLLQGIIRDYPNTTPASVARKRLIDIKE